MTYAADQLRAEVAYVAYHFHWPLDVILDLEHADRAQYIGEISRLNEAAVGR